MTFFTTLLMEWSSEEWTPQEQVARWNVDQRRLVNYVVSVVTEKIMFAPSSADITERQLNYPHAALDLSPCDGTSKGAVSLKRRNSQIINCMADTKYQLQFNSFNSFIYSINV